jgi:hypothetical protein
VKNSSPEKNRDLSFYDPTPLENHALTMVLATDPTSIARPKRFRSYCGDGFDKPDTTTPIWQVALATITTPLDLDPVTFPATETNLEYTCIASSLAGFSNPSWISLIEAQEHFHPNSVHSVLNIGSGGKSDSRWPMALGHPLPVVRGLALTRMVIGQVNDANHTVTQVESHQQMLRESANTGLYYRYFSDLTVNTSYYDWSKDTRRLIDNKTTYYLGTAQMKSQIEETAKHLAKLQGFRVTQQHASVLPDIPLQVSRHKPDPPLIDIEENSAVDKNTTSGSALPAESRKSPEDILRIPSRGRASLAG